jgi:hypothetical protein
MNIPVLIVSGHPEINDRLRHFGYPCLAKPIGLDSLCAEAVRVTGESRENIWRVKASAAKMLANTEALSAAELESRRLLREIKAQKVVRETGNLPTRWPFRRRNGDRARGRSSAGSAEATGAACLRFPVSVRLRCGNQ